MSYRPVVLKLDGKEKYKKMKIEGMKEDVLGALFLLSPHKISCNATTSKFFTHFSLRDDIIILSG